MGVVAEIFDEAGIKLFEVPVKFDGDKIVGSSDFVLPVGRQNAVAWSWKIGNLDGFFDRPHLMTNRGRLTISIDADAVGGTGDAWRKYLLGEMLASASRPDPVPEPEPEPPARTGYKYGGML